MTTLATKEIHGMPVLIVKEGREAWYFRAKDLPWTDEQLEEVRGMGEVFEAACEGPSAPRPCAQVPSKGSFWGVGTRDPGSKAPGGSWWPVLLLMGVVLALAWLGRAR